MKPLEGVKVLNLTTYIAASSCARMMADWGADVIKVESPTGDGYRKFGRAYGCPITDDCNPQFDSLNANERGIVINLKTPEGLELFNKMLAEADVFLTNTRNKALIPLGLDYETLMKKYPRLIIANLNAYGEKGKEVDRPGYDTMAVWTRCGFTHDCSPVDGDSFCPTFPIMGAGDIPVAMGLMAAIVSALYARLETGKGDRVGISLQGTGLWMGSQMIQSSQYGHPYPKGRTTQIPVGAAFECSDGNWFNCNVVNFPRDYPIFCRLLGIEDLIGHPVYSDRAAMAKPDVADYLYHRYAEGFKKHPQAYWKEKFEENDLCYECVGTFAGDLVDQNAWDNDFLYEMKHENGTSSTLIRPPMRSVNMGLSDYRRAPKLGEHTKEVLGEFGLSQEEISTLIEKGAVKQYGE